MSFKVKVTDVKIKQTKMGFGNTLIFLLILRVTCDDDKLVDTLDDVVSEQIENNK